MAWFDGRRLVPVPTDDLGGLPSSTAEAHRDGEGENSVGSYEEAVLTDRRSATRFVVAQTTMNAGATLAGANWLWVDSVALTRIGFVAICFGALFEFLSPLESRRVASRWSVLSGGLLASALSRVGLPRALALFHWLGFIMLVAALAFGRG